MTQNNYKLHLQKIGQIEIHNNMIWKLLFKMTIKEIILILGTTKKCKDSDYNRKIIRKCSEINNPYINAFLNLVLLDFVLYFINPDSSNNNDVFELIKIFDKDIKKSFIEEFKSKNKSMLFLHPFEKLSNYPEYVFNIIKEFIKKGKN